MSDLLSPAELMSHQHSQAVAVERGLATRALDLAVQSAQALDYARSLVERLAGQSPAGLALLGEFDHRCGPALQSREDLIAWCRRMRVGASAPPPAPSR